MMHLHIVCRYKSVSMERMVAPLLAQGALSKHYKLTISGEPEANADINYHIPWHTLVGLDEKTSKHAILYTHVNPTDKNALIDACSRADKIVCMSFTGRQELIDLGVDAKKLWVAYPGTNEFPFRRRNIGVIGFEQPNGRKRTHLLMDLAWAMPTKYKNMLHFVLVGSGWSELADQLNNAGVLATYKEEISHEDLVEIYGLLDALLVTAYAEGGPLPFLEAYASGVPVFAPPIGFAGDFLETLYTYKSPDELMRKIGEWLRPTMRNAYLASTLNHTQYVAETALALSQISGASVEVVEGYDRYAQLLAIVDAIKPLKIVEIGTWNGTRAVEMLQMAARHARMDEIEYIGYDLFDLQTDKDLVDEHSKQGWPWMVVKKRVDATGAKNALISGNTRDTLYKGFGRLQNADLYFIDGGHSEKTIQHDWDQIAPNMGAHSVAVFDDYYHGDHPVGMGCNALVDKLPRDMWRVNHLPVITDANGLMIGMVEVCRANV